MLLTCCDHISTQGMSSDLRDATKYTKPITSQFASIHSRYSTSKWQVTADLGKLLLLNFGVTKRYGTVNMGFSIGKSLGLIRINILLAYHCNTSVSDEIDYIVARSSRELVLE